MLRRCRRPIPGTDFVNKAVYQIIFLGPLAYSFGSLTWSNFDPNGIPPEAIIPNLVALFLSIFLVILPINSFIIGCCFSENTNVKLTNYEDDRSFILV